MKKMNKVLALLAFAGVVTGVSLHAAAPKHQVAVAVETIYGGLVTGGFKPSDLNQPEKVAEWFDTAYTAAWETIELKRGMRPTQSFATYFTKEELYSVIDGFASVITAIEVAAPAVIWPTGIRGRVRDDVRNAYKDALIVALEKLQANAALKVEEAYQASAIYAADRARIMDVVTPQIAALKQRVIDVFTIKPTAERVAALNARVPGAAGKKVAKLATDRVAAHAAAKAEVDEAAQVTRFGAVLRTIGRTSWFAAKTVAALAVVYSIPMALAYARAHGWIA